MLEDCTFHTMQGATARQLGFAWHVAMLWDDDQARYRSASRVLMNQVQRHSTSRAVAFVIETQAGGCVNQDLLLDDGTVVTRTQMMKTGRRRGGNRNQREIISFFISIFFVLKFPSDVVVGGVAAAPSVRHRVRNTCN